MKWRSNLPILLFLKFIRELKYKKFTVFRGRIEGNDNKGVTHIIITQLFGPISKAGETSISRLGNF